MVNMFQVISVVAVMALTAAVNAYPGYAHHGFHPLSAPSHGYEYHVSTLICYGTHSIIIRIIRNCCPALGYVFRNKKRQTYSNVFNCMKSKSPEKKIDG
jgi:hypothetical protein